MLKTSLVILISTISIFAQTQDSCKSPAIEKRALADDVRFASPFYVIALPKTPRTDFIDNVCYTYFENGSGGFNHIMSVTYKDNNYQYYKFTKGDIPDRIGLAEAISQTRSTCKFHDHTLKPICNSTVFILYRCFIDGNCADIDVGRMPGIDVRVVLAANPIVSDECKKETETSLKNTSFFSGGNYITLPQKLKPKCVTKYNGDLSIGSNRAVGSIEVNDMETSDKFGGELNNQDSTSKQYQNYSFTQQNQPWMNSNVPVRKPSLNQAVPNKQAFNPYGINIKGSSSTTSSPGHSSKPGYTPNQNWNHNGQWNVGPNPWTGQNHAGETHHHMWQQQNNINKPNNNNVIYHVHRWETPPPGCCKCN